MVLLSQCLTTILVHNQNTGDDAESRHISYSAVLESVQKPEFIETVIGEAFKIIFFILH